MKCRIQWVDSHGRPTPDDSDAIGYVYREAYRHPFPTAVNGYIDYERTENVPVCSEHAKQLSEPDMHHWHFLPLMEYVRDEETARELRKATVEQDRLRATSGRPQ
jgi:hypothetical protein